MTDLNLDTTTEDLVAFYEQIASLQDQLLILHPRMSVSIDDEQMKEYLEKKKYWLQLLTFPLDPIRFIKDYLETASFIIKSRPKIKNTIVAMNDLISRPCRSMNLLIRP